MEIRIYQRTLLIFIIMILAWVPLQVIYTNLMTQPKQASILPVPKQRANITDRNGVVLARTIITDPGTFNQNTKRHYPLGSVGGQLLGVMGIDKGLEGIERAYEEELAGGVPVQLTIDSELQATAEIALATWGTRNEAQHGSAVIMHAKTGELLAVASWPPLDPNNWKGVSAARLRNRPLIDRFEPGSVIKSLSVAAALDYGSVKDNQQFVLPMRRHIGGRWGTVINDSVAHGQNMSLMDILRFSSNVGMSHVVEKIPGKTFRQQMLAFGFNRPVPLGKLPSASGVLQNEERFGDLVKTTTSFGQGMSATLLQVTAAYAVLANDGRYVSPKLIVTQESPEQTVPVPAATLPGKVSTDNTPPPPPVDPMTQAPTAGTQVVSPTAAMAVRRMMRQTVELGLPQSIMIDGYDLSGKTGTAQVIVDGRYSPDIYESTFVGLYPGNDPEIVVAVEAYGAQKGHHGSELAAPATRDIVAGYISQRAVKPDEKLLESQLAWRKEREQGLWRR